MVFCFLLYHSCTFSSTLVREVQDVHQAPGHPSVTPLLSPHALPHINLVNVFRAAWPLRTEELLHAPRPGPFAQRAAHPTGLAQCLCWAVAHRLSWGGCPIWAIIALGLFLLRGDGPAFTFSAFIFPDVLAMALYCFLADLMKVSCFQIALQL